MDVTEDQIFFLEFRSSLQQAYVLPQNERHVNFRTFPSAMPMMTGEGERRAPCGIMELAGLRVLAPAFALGSMNGLFSL